jgi:hypothetical protein
MKGKEFVTLLFLSEGVVPITILHDSDYAIDEFLPKDPLEAKKAKRKFRKLKRKAKKQFPKELGGSCSNFDKNQLIVERYLILRLSKNHFPNADLQLQTSMTFWRFGF